MSRVGSSAIAIPSGVTVSQQGGLVVVKGKNGELTAPLHNEIELTVSGEVATVKPRRKTKISQSLWGTMRATISNMVVGVAEGFSRTIRRMLKPNVFRRCASARSQSDLAVALLPYSSMPMPCSAEPWPVNM